VLRIWAYTALTALLFALGTAPGVDGQETSRLPLARLGNPISPEPAPTAPTLPMAPRQAETAPPPRLLGDPGMATLPITLAAALQLANARPLDIQVAQQSVAIAAAQLQRAEALWLPTVYLGGDYYRHDGQLMDDPGNVFGTSKSSLMVGAGPSMVFATTDAIFGPLAARQDLRAKGAALQTSRNDTLLAVAEAYFAVQEARGQLAGAELVLHHAEELVRRADQLAPGLVPPVEAVRARAELALRRQAISSAREHWRVSSADLGRLLRLDASVPVLPAEPPNVQIDLLSLDHTVDDLIPLALTNRPELAGQQALVQAALERMRQEKMRPLMPSILLRGTSTTPTGTLSGGYFGGGNNGALSNWSARGDFDLQILWEWQNLGFGNQARVKEKQAEHQQAILDLFRLQDRIAAEVAQAYAQVQESRTRIIEATEGLKLAAESVQKNFEGLGQTRRLGGEMVLLLVRPQEVVAAIQTLGQANAAYYFAIADYDRAQFRLYRALGQPAQTVIAVAQSKQ
jgi:outer membrane protein TolC